MQLGPLVIHPEEWQTAVKAPEHWLSGDCNAADWALYDGGKVKGKRFFRFIVVHDHLRFAPQRPDRRIYMVNGTIQALTLRIGSPGQWMLPDYSLNLELPRALSVPLYESGKRTYNRYAHDLQDTVSGEMRFLRFAYREPMPALPYNWGFHVANFLLDVRFPSSERAQTFPIRIYQRGRGVAEFPQKYELVILPELKPGKPERIMINLWDVERGNCFSTSEMNLILESFAQCGINYAGIHLVNDDDLIVSRRARELGMKTMMAHSGAHSPFLRKRLAEKPEHRAVNPVYPPQAWQTAMCPLAFQEDPWVRERFRCLCPHFDVMLDDVERGMRAACLCARCRAAFARRFQLRKIPEAKEIYERYPEQIELFQIEMNREVFDFQLDLARQVHPGIASMVYSGYDSARARNAYGIDWKRYRDLDFASCGYEMERRVIDATRKALNGAEIVCGLIIDSSMYEKNLARQNLRGLLFHQLRNSGFGGILFWKWRELDGRGMTALADFSRGVAEFENFLDESRQCREGFTFSGMSTEDVTIYRDGDRYLVYAVNLSSRPRRLTVTSEVLPRGEAFDFFSARRFHFHKTFQVNIPAMDAALIMLKQGGH